MIGLILIILYGLMILAATALLSLSWGIVALLLVSLVLFAVVWLIYFAI